MNGIRRRYWCAIRLLAMLTTAVAGCGRTPEQAFDNALRQTGRQKETVAALAGRVTIDGQAPGYDPRNTVVVLLVERDKIDAPRQNYRSAACGAEGNFSFGTYAPHDGIKPGSYVVAFAKLKRMPPRGFEGPDQLQNLYNDPDKNAREAEFLIEHKVPGKTDYVFDLKVAGVEPVNQPGPKAFTSLRIAGGPVN
jgi:hypothetical protein